ncbi:MAG: 50S ribosomal protein L11 methyltransferase [Prevotellaceae bacterium]|jgi:ribosomal protein L11 methyltransferase|nr:50S ribosomal protein L11 methyltransferase [Prevotellaceae bacterium]
MNYFEVVFSINPNEEWLTDLISNDLSEIGFESFVTTQNGLTAYVSETKFDRQQLDALIANFPYEAQITCKANLVKTEDWNAEWEKNYFQPIVVADRCVVRSSFHTEAPKAEYEIVIDPKMSFGTGHHETTSLMISRILQTDFRGKSVLDMGCGTGILAILAGMRDANPITAIDIDEWVYDNILENLKLNGFENIEVKIGDAALLPGRKFDIILANINRNILLNDIKIYAECLNDGGELFMSGFYKEDIDAIKQEAEKQGLQYMGFEEKNNWVAVGFKK